MSTVKKLSPLSLAERQTDLTRRLILDAAIELLEKGSVRELTVRAVAKRANIAERTVFRYFPDRDEFLGAVTQALRARLALPAPPGTREELLAAPRALYTRFDEIAQLIKASLHSELFHRIRQGVIETRSVAVRKIVDELAPRRTPRERRIAAANIFYYLTATTWHYYRFYFGFSLEDSITAAELAIEQQLLSLGATLPRPRKAA